MESPTRLSDKRADCVACDLWLRTDPEISLRVSRQHVQEFAGCACDRFRVVAMQVHDIEDLVKVGHSMQACPYFAARHYKGVYVLQPAAYHSSLLQHVLFPCCAF